jgi:hypothetical protein
LERTEWQVAPAPGPPSIPARYELVGASAVVLRIVASDSGSDRLSELARVVEDMLAPSIATVYPGSASTVGSFGQDADCGRHFAMRLRSSAG